MEEEHKIGRREKWKEIIANIIISIIVVIVVALVSIFMYPAWVIYNIYLFILKKMRVDKVLLVVILSAAMNGIIYSWVYTSSIKNTGKINLFPIRKHMTPFNYYPINGTEPYFINQGDTVRICSGFDFDTVVIEQINEELRLVQYYSIRIGSLGKGHMMDRRFDLFEQHLIDCQFLNKKDTNDEK